MMSPMGRPGSRNQMRAASPAFHHQLLRSSSTPIPNIPDTLPPGYVAPIQWNGNHTAAPAYNTLPLVSPGLNPTESDAEIAKKLVGQDILQVDMFSKEELHVLFNVAHSLKIAVKKERPLDYILRVWGSTDLSVINYSFISQFY